MTRGPGISFFLIGTLSVSLDFFNKSDKLVLSLFEEGTVIFTFFGSTCPNDDSDLFLLLELYGESDSVVSPAPIFSVIFSFPLIAFSSMIYLSISMTKILLGVSLFSLLFLVYVRIRFRMEEFRCEHPAGARYLGSNGQTTTTSQTKPVCQFD